jgi:hypothetical protein
MGLNASMETRGVMHEGDIAHGGSDLHAASAFGPCRDEGAYIGARAGLHIGGKIFSRYEPKSSSLREALQTR